MATTAKHQVLIVGGGTAGITVASRLLRKGYTDVAVIEPSDKHYYQPLWTLVGGGQATAAQSERAESSVMPKKATWIRKSAGARRTTLAGDVRTGRPTATTRWWSAPVSSWTGTRPRASLRRWTGRGSPRTSNF